MKTHHAPTVRVCSSSSKEVRLLPLASGFYAWVGAMVDFLPSSSSGGSPEGAAWLPRRPAGDGLKTQK
jgi:hypothetical protein